MPADIHIPTCITSASLAYAVPPSYIIPTDQKPVPDPTLTDDILDERPPAEPPPSLCQGQIDFSVPVPKMTKSHDNPTWMFPPGSLLDPDDINHPPSLTTPFEFPLDLKSDQTLDGMLAGLPYMPTAMDSVTHMVGFPRVCGLSS